MVINRTKAVDVKIHAVFAPFNSSANDKLGKSKRVRASDAAGRRGYIFLLPGSWSRQGKREPQVMGYWYSFVRHLIVLFRCAEQEKMN